MIQNMRHLAQSWLFKGLMLILVISFGIWGIGDIFKGNPAQREVAKAGEISITAQELDRAFQEDLIRAHQTYGMTMTAQQAKQAGLLDRTLDNLIQRAELDQEIKRLGIAADEKTVLTQLMTQPQFKDRDGAFKKALFEKFLEQIRLNERDFLAQGKKDLERHQLIDLFSDDRKVPQAFVDALYKMRGQKRILEVVTLKNDSIKDIPTPDEKALRDFHQQNPQAFTAPEYRSIAVVKLSSDDLAKDISISDDELQKTYDTKGEPFMKPERRDLVQVIAPDEAKAKELAAKATKGDLTVVSQSMKLDFVPLNGTEEKNLPPELAKPVFALQVGDVSAPIKTSFGWHVVQLKKIIPAGKQDFKDAKASLRETMKRDQAIETVTRLVNELDDQLAAGHSLDDIADGMKLRLVKTPPLDAQGKTADGKDPAELPNRAEVLKTAFGQNADETSPVIDDKHGNYIVIRTNEVTPSALKPFEQVKEQVAAAWKTQEQAKRAGAEAEKIAKALREGKEAESFAQQAGVEVRKSKPISQLGDSDPSLPATALSQIMALKKGDVIVSAQPDKQLILKLSQLLDATPVPDSDTTKDALRHELGKQLPEELIEQYLDHLHTEFPVKIHQDLLDSIKQQGN